MTEPRFLPEMTVGAALALHPSARWVFAAHHLFGCTGCAASADETLEEVATGYQLPLERMLADLNALLA